MGFYGNITNTSKTNFVFDKIYTNRKAMDENIAKDGIFIGRYVLVEYGQITNDSFIRVYQNDNKFYTSNKYEINTQILYTSNKAQVKDRYITNGIVIYTITKNNKNEDVYTYYECNGGVNNGNPTFADNPGLDPNNDPYFFNFNQDKAVKEYDTSRGYDGTVWVKTTVNNEIKYVNIAELNSVVPSFDMVADAPTMSPILPHFDTASNNVYYKLHWQPAWGMRVAEAEQKDGKIYSDYVTSWSQEVYNKETGKAFTQWYFPTETQDGVTGVWRALKDKEQVPTINADIYFNKAAFDPQVGKPTINKDVNYRPITLTSSTYVKGKYYYKSGNNYFPDNRGFNSSRNPYYEKLENYIGITADGLSGNEYNLHDGTSKTEQQPDTQQIHINLPAIGNMMSEAWDIIHGEKRDNSTVDSLQGRLNFFKNEINSNEIPIQSQENYLVGSVINGDVSYEASKDNSGSDKSVYNENILTVEINSGKQYEHDDAWIATNIDTNQGKEGEKDYHRKAISIHHTFHPRVDSDINELNINAYDGTKNGSDADGDTGFQKIVNKDTIQLYVPKVDKAGHVVGTDIDKVILPYGYKHIATIGNNPEETKDLDKVQDTLSADGSDVTAGTPIGKTAIVATETQDTVNIDPFNKWIQVKASDDTVEIAHEIHGIITEEKETNLNDGTNTITFHDLEFDAAGHVEKNQLHTYTLPYGYKYFETDGLSTEDAKDLYTKNADKAEGIKETKDTEKITNKTQAHNTQDVLTINPANKWIQTKFVDSEGNQDELVIAHEIHSIDERNSENGDKDNEGKSTSHTNLNNQTATGGNEQNLTMYDWDYDEAGHIISKRKHTYTLPYGYKTFTDGTNSSVANTTQDTFKFIGDSWLQPTVDNDQITYTHIGPVTTDAQNLSDETPKFGDTFKIEDWAFDGKGHQANLSAHTIKIPGLSLTNATTGNVVTGIAYTYDETNHKGSFTETKENVGDLQLGTYTGTTETTNGLNISSTDTIDEAFDKTQTHINSLILDDESTTQFITKITQTDGQVAVERAAAGTLVLGEKDTDYSVSETASAIEYDDDLATAFGKVEAQIKAETAARQKEIADLINSAPEALDTLGEVAGWIENDKTGAAAMANAIATLNSNADTPGSVANSIKTEINKLNMEDTAQTDQYVSAVSESNGVISVARVALPTYTLAEGTAEGTVNFNGTNIKVKGLGSAAYTDTSAYLSPTAKFVYTEAITDTNTGTITTPATMITIDKLVKKVAALEKALNENGIILPPEEVE